MSYVTWDGPLFNNKNLKVPPCRHARSAPPRFLGLLMIFFIDVFLIILSMKDYFSWVEFTYCGLFEQIPGRQTGLAVQIPQDQAVWQRWWRVCEEELQWKGCQTEEVTAEETIAIDWQTGPVLSNTGDFSCLWFGISLFSSRFIMTFSITEGPQSFFLSGFTITGMR